MCLVTVTDERVDVTTWSQEPSDTPTEWLWLDIVLHEMQLYSRALELFAKLRCGDRDQASGALGEVAAM